MARPVYDTYACEVCDKPVSRLLGVGAKIELPDGRFQVRPAVIGYCYAHRDESVPAWLADLSSDGHCESLGEPVELRPQDAQQFLRHANRMLAEEMGAYTEVDPSEGVPSQCPHCGGELRWGEGPHTNEPTVRAGKAFAWECASCGAAGLLSTEF